MTSEIARDKAARLLKRRGSASSMASQDVTKTDLRYKKYGPGSMSTVSYLDEPGHDIEHTRYNMKLENTYQMEPPRKFPDGEVKSILQDVLESYLGAEKYDPQLCREMTKTISEVVKARVKDLCIPRFKIICLIHIGQLQSQGLRVASRCLWDNSNDTFASYDFRNNSIFAVGTVYGIYSE